MQELGISCSLSGYYLLKADIIGSKAGIITLVSYPCGSLQAFHRDSQQRIFPLAKIQNNAL